MGVRWTMPSPRVANMSDVFVSDECESPKKLAAAAATANASPPSTGGLVYKKAPVLDISPPLFPPPCMPGTTPVFSDLAP